MPALKYREAELRLVLCIVCLEPYTKKGIREHRKKKHGLVGGKLRDLFLEPNEEIEKNRSFVKIKSVADINQYKDLGKSSNNVKVLYLIITI